MMEKSFLSCLINVIIKNRHDDTLVVAVLEPFLCFYSIFVCLWQSFCFLFLHIESFHSFSNLNILACFDCFCGSTGGNSVEADDPNNKELLVETFEKQQHVLDITAKML